MTRKVTNHVSDEGLIRIGDEYAAKWTSENLYIFSYFEDEGEIRERINAMHLTLGETELRALADEACSVFGGCDFLKNAEVRAATAPDLLAALERIEGILTVPDLGEDEQAHMAFAFEAVDMAREIARAALAGARDEGGE